MIKTIIIDDEHHSIRILKSLFDEYFDFVEVVDTANSVKEGKLSIIKYAPDLVFLDIRMNDGTGFDLLNSLPTINFKVVFITAYSEYALNAIKAHAFDYLLKPIDIDELSETLMLLKREVDHVNNHKKKYPSKLAIPQKNGITYLNVNQILRIEAQGSYCKIHVSEKEVFTVSNNLKHFENKLDPLQFFRCHHSHIINLSKVERVTNEIGMEAILVDGSYIDISKRKKADFYKNMELNLNF